MAASSYVGKAGQLVAMEEDRHKAEEHMVRGQPGGDKEVYEVWRIRRRVCRRHAYVNSEDEPT